MHLKNFSLIHTQGQWQLAPAYDLLNVCIANPVDSEELALTLEGKKRRSCTGNISNGLGKGWG